MRTAAWLSGPCAAVAVAAAAALASQDRAAAPMDTSLFRDIARRQNPTVVAITTRAPVDEVSADVKGWFEWFFGEPLPDDDRIERGLGSGFLISSDGEILTNNHVVARADVIEVGLLGDVTKTYRATLIGRDPGSDSALIRLENPPRHLPFATLGDSDDLESGDWVMAIGNPFQLGHTVTVGVVSYQGRAFEVSEGTLQTMIQTDAAINPGNSGGPLINVRGEVVGINAAILGPGSDGNSGIGFAVPINSVKPLLPQLRAGRVVRGRLGVQVQGAAISDDEADALGLPAAAGALITAVEPNSPADTAGIEAGDVVIGFDGRSIATADDLIPRISFITPGSRVAIGVIRDGRERTLHATVGELAVETTAVPPRRGEDVGDYGLILGDVTGSATPPVRPVAGPGGAVVTGVREASPAARAGLRKGDVVRRVNRRETHSAADASSELDTIRGAGPAFILVWRDGRDVLLQMRRD
jgi:serine protease Do